MSWEKKQKSLNGIYPQIQPADPCYVNIAEQEIYLIHLMNMQAITPADYRSLYKQLHSSDKENHVVAEQCILEIIRNL